MNKIIDICTFYPKSKIKAGEGMTHGRFPFYTSSNTLNKYLNSYQIEEDGIILGTGGNASIHYCSGRFSASTDCLVICSKNPDIYNEYLYYYLLNSIHILENGFRGAGLKHISKKYIEDIEINYIPDVNIQKKIINIINKSKILINKRKEQIEALDELVKSQFIEMFGDPKDNNKGWEIKKLGDIYKVGSSKRIYQREQTSSGIPFLRISDLVKRIETGNNSCELYISEEQYNSFKAKMLVPLENDILVTSRGTLGLCYIVKEKDKFYFQDGMISWLKQIDVDVDPIYITTLFSMNGFRKQIDEIPTGTTVNYLSIARLANLEVMYPNIKLQNEFSNFVKQVEKLKFKMEQSLKGLENNFNSLMKDSFSGNLSL